MRLLCPRIRILYTTLTSVVTFEIELDNVILTRQYNNIIFFNLVAILLKTNNKNIKLQFVTFLNKMNTINFYHQ